MIFDYGFSIVGKSHIAKGTCCQDAHYITKLDNGWYIAAIADGVGSASNSQIGSKIASKTVVEFCKKYMPYDYNVISIKSMMRTAYNYAFKTILKESERSKEPIESYDTTLSMVIFDGKRVIYGHSGDGAIIGLTEFGDFVEITKPQKGPDGVTVLPLRSGYTQWVIDVFEEDLASVMLMTDGMLETLCPYLLRDHENKKNRVYTPLGAFFADPSGILESIQKQKMTKKLIEDFIIADESYNADDFFARLSVIYENHIKEDSESIIEQLKLNNYPIALMQNEQDDKTMVALINTETGVEDKSASFYAEPDWSSLQDAWNRMAYPHLYAEKQEKQKKFRKADSTIEDEESEITESDTKEKSSNDSDSQFAKSKDILVKKPAEQTTESESIVKDTDKILSIVSEHHNNDSSGKSQDGNQHCKTKTSSNETVAPKHDKPKKKNIIEKIGDLFD